MASESFNNDFTGHDANCREIALPQTDIDPQTNLRSQERIEPRADSGESRQVIDPQPNVQAVLPNQLACKPPAHADITEVVDNVAENVAAKQGGRSHESGA